MTHLMHEWEPVPEIRDPKGGSRDPGPSSLVGPGTRDLKGGTQDPGHLFYMGPKIQDPGHWKKDLIDETRDSKQTSLVEPRTQELWSK